MKLLRDILWDLLRLMGFYVAGILASFGWLMIGFYVYFTPMPIDTKLGSDFYRDLGTSLVAQGLIFGTTFIVGFVIKAWNLGGNDEQEEAKKDRQMLQELHQWMQEQKSNPPVTVTTPDTSNVSPTINKLDVDAAINPPDPAMNGNSTKAGVKHQSKPTRK